MKPRGRTQMYNDVELFKGSSCFYEDYRINSDYEIQVKVFYVRLVDDYFQHRNIKMCSINNRFLKIVFISPENQLFTIGFSQSHTASRHNLLFKVGWFKMFCIIESDALDDQSEFSIKWIEVLK